MDQLLADEIGHGLREEGERRGGDTQQIVVSLAPHERPLGARGADVETRRFVGILQLELQESERRREAELGEIRPRRGDRRLGAEIVETLQHRLERVAVEAPRRAVSIVWLGASRDPG